MAAEEPAHKVDAHALRRILEPDSVPLALVHVFALFVAKKGIAEAAAEGLAVLQDSAHRQQRIEPVAELTGEALRYPIGGKPLLPMGAVVAVIQRRVGNDPRVQPGVAHVRDARHLLAAL